MIAYLISIFLASPFETFFRVAILQSDGDELPAQTCEQALTDGLDYAEAIPAPSPVSNPLLPPEPPEIPPPPPPATTKKFTL